MSQGTKAKPKLSEVLSFISGLAKGDFSKALNHIDDPTLGPIAEELNSAAKALAAQAAEATKSAQAAEDASYIVDSLGIGIWKWDLITNSLEWDKNMYRLYGADPSDFSGAYDAWENSLSAETKAKAVEEINVAVAGGKSFDTTFQVVQRKTGKVQEIRTRAFIIRDHDGKPSKMWGINLDRTREAELELKVKKTIHSLEATTQFLEKTGEMAKVGGWELDLKTGNVHMSEQTKILHEIDGNFKPLNYSTGSEWYPPDAWRVVQEAVQMAIEQGKSYDLESPFITAKGKKIWVRVQGFPEREDGKVTRLRGTFQDITERKESEIENIKLQEENRLMLERVNQQKLFFEQVLNSLPNMVFVKDYNKNLSFTMFNRAGEKLLEVKQSDVIGKNDYDFFPKEQADFFIQKDIEVFKKKELVEIEKEPIQTPQGQRWLKTYKVPIFNEDGSPHLLIGISTDITDTLKTQELLESERMKSVQSAKLASLGEMSAGVAHEINNPLAIISGTVSLLKKFKDNEVKFDSKLETIVRAVGRIEKIVKGLRKFSRTSEGNVHSVNSLEEIIAESLVLADAKSKRHSVKVTTHVTPNLFINCDSVEIEQVIINLINNSIDAVKTREERWIKINAFSTDKVVVLQVVDSGPGISPEIEKKLFEPFFTTKAVGEGTGLGLSISKGILESHHATITLIKDFPNTCFEIRFPKIEVARSAA